MTSLAVRACALAVATAAVLTGGGAAGTSAADNATPFRDCFRLLAGSPQTLVYARFGRCSTSEAAQLIARDKSGTTRILTNALDDSNTYGWSLSGELLTAYHAQEDANPLVKWWNIATGEAGELTLAGPAYVSAGPGGVLFLTTDGVLKLESLTGTVTRWAKVSKDGDLMYSYAGDAGVVLGLRNRLRYVSFDDPATVHHLRDGGSSATKCLGMSAVYAACVLRNVQRPQRYKVLALVPLDGSAPIETRDRKQHGTGPVALAGRQTIFWLRLPPPGRTIHLTSRRGDATRRVKGPVRVDLFPDMVSAYGEAVAVPTGGDKIIAATTARHFTTLVTAP